MVFVIKLCKKVNMKSSVMNKPSLVTWLCVCVRINDRMERSEVKYTEVDACWIHADVTQNFIPGSDFANYALDSGTARGEIPVTWLTTALQMCILVPWATQRKYKTQLLYKIGKRALVQPEGNGKRLKISLVSVCVYAWLLLFHEVLVLRPWLVKLV